ncbi:hypothetical protein F2Q68_00011392 [Brassica cretica]|uniref:F-box domain-containing protein n=1 Tax=Brassica cretica TaxID=69181 RepID=A0A8S9KUV2_BRACR|nr:hypothetical protein F2Q68_00011392 [Brassica cretica]
MTMMSDLPGDLLEEILCRVPAVSPKRLLFSCKRWNRLFNDKQLSTKHLNKAAKQSLVFKVTQYSRACLMSVNLHGTPSVEFKACLSRGRRIDLLPIEKMNNSACSWFKRGWIQASEEVLMDICTAEEIEKML